MQHPFWIVHWPPRRGYLWYRLMHFIFPDPNVKYSEINSFVILLSNVVHMLLLSILMPSSLYMYIYIIIFNYIILGTIGSFILSYFHFLRKLVVTLFILQILYYPLKIFLGFNLSFIINYLLKMLKWLLRF